MKLRIEQQLNLLIKSVQFVGINVKWDGEDAHWMPAEACDLV